jgi:Mn2+/Fe2+ NRAMP family transporter
MYGLALVVFIVLAMLAKYPAFVFASRYAVATGKSLLSGYRQQGKPALIFFGLSTLLTMFIGTAANLLICAGLAKTALHWNLGLIMQGKEEDATGDPKIDRLRHRYYWAAMGLMVVGALIILDSFLDDLSRLVDFAATISFLSAPAYAFFNHRCIMSADVPEDAKPGKWMSAWSRAGMTILSLFALLYLFLVISG